MRSVGGLALPPVGETGYAVPPASSAYRRPCRDEGTMTTETNKVIVQRFFHELLDQGNSAVEAELLTEDCVRHFPARTITGPVLYSNVRTTIHDLIAEGDRVVARITHQTTFAADEPEFSRVG